VKIAFERVKGIPTVEDRVAQMVAKIYFEPNVEKIYFMKIHMAIDLIN